MKVHAVFEGGGVKAVALAGAVCEAERRGVQFCNVAGTSSGSIVAALIAAGYTGEEMRQIVENTPFSQFLRKTWLHRIKGIGPVIRLFVKKGLYSGDRLERWIERILQAKGIRTFGDLRPGQLKIIASDISNGKLLVLPDGIAKYGLDPERLPVAKAIRMSTSIPYFFDPVLIRKPVQILTKGASFADQFVYIVDGGLLSNFPLWLFEPDRDPPEDYIYRSEPAASAPTASASTVSGEPQKQETKKQESKKQETKQEAKIQGTVDRIPVVGFQLVGKLNPEPHRIVGPLTMFQALFATMLEAHDERYIEDVNRFRTIKIPTYGVRTTEFHLSEEKKKMLYESGVQAAAKFFDRWSYARYINMLQQTKKPAASRPAE